MQKRFIQTLLYFVLPFLLTGQELMINGGFEPPPSPPPGMSYVITNADNVPGWNASGGSIELWVSGLFNIPAFDGVQLAELNVGSITTYSQDLSIPSPYGGSIDWSFAHRARGGGLETVEFFIGPPGILVSQGQFSSSNGAWSTYNGTFQVSPGQDTIQIAVTSISPTASAGNLVDGFSAVFTATVPPPVPTMNEWALFLFGLLTVTLGFAGVYNLRKSAAVTS